MNPAKATVVAAVIERDGRYLICRRPPEKQNGSLWEFPGGKVVEGESLDAALIRELDEELGLQVQRVGNVLYRADHAGAFEILFIEAEAGGEPECREHSQIAWVDKDRLSDYELAPADMAFARVFSEQARSR